MSITIVENETSQLPVAVGEQVLHGLSEYPRDRRWLPAVCQGLRLQPWMLEARRDGQVVGELPLAFVKSRLFGRFLVSLPYVNWAGVLGDDESVTAMVDRACQLADRLDVRYLELRHEVEIQHPKLTDQLTTKCHMRLPLSATSEALWKSFSPKVRNQVRKGEKQAFEIAWGREDLLPEFYEVFSRRMRELGTPVYGKRLFTSILKQFPDKAEFCVLRDGRQVVGGALLVHGEKISEVPSASTLTSYNPKNPNMLMYWQLLQRAIERGQTVFDFGRCSLESPTHRFKKQWGAKASPAVWQYYLRHGQMDDMRPDNSRYRRKVAVWQRLPLWLTKLAGPWIVRGIP